jgi:hypothetical protein
MLKIVKISKSALIKNFHRCIATTSYRHQGSEVTQFKEKYDAIKIPDKKPKREPLVKNFFVAKVDTELIAFPEAFYDTKVLDQAKLRRDSYSDFLTSNVYTNPNDGKNIYKLSQFGSFSCDPSLTTEQLFAQSEPESKVMSYNYFISTHKTVGEIIINHANEQMRTKYLPQMNRGEIFGSICLTDTKPSTIEGRPLSTTASFSDRDDMWTINGEKSFVLLNDLNSTVLLVAAAVESTDRIGDFEEKIGLFLVDGNTSGVSISQNINTIGFEETAFKRVTIKFDDVKVSKGKFLFLILKIYANFLFLSFSYNTQINL